MKVKVQCGESKFECNLTEERAIEVFQRTVVDCIGGTVRYEEPVNLDNVTTVSTIYEPPTTSSESEPLKVVNNTKYESLVDTDSANTSSVETGLLKRSTNGFWGFLRIRCGGCGEARMFNSKEPIKYYKCKLCEFKTDLAEDNMHLAFFTCSGCGNSFKYRTNETECSFIIDCMNCGSPNDLVFNERRKSYNSL